MTTCKRKSYNQFAVNGKQFAGELIVTVFPLHFDAHTLLTAVKTCYCYCCSWNIYNGTFSTFPFNNDGVRHTGTLICLHALPVRAAEIWERGGCFQAVKWTCIHRAKLVADVVSSYSNIITAPQKVLLHNYYCSDADNKWNEEEAAIKHSINSL